MQRITVTLDGELVEDIDSLIASRGYAGRSEAIRDLVRAGLREARETQPTDGPSVAALIYTYKHSQRDLARRLTRAAHDHHDLAVATLHVHLDHDTCLEATVLRGPAGELRHFAEHQIAERGVSYGRLLTIPTVHGVRRHKPAQGG